jgi:hypothetical protein
MQTDWRWGMAVQLDEAAMEDMLHSPDGLVGVYINGLAVQMGFAARAGAPARAPQNESWIPAKSTSYPSLKFPDTETLRASIKSVFGYNKAGNMYGGVNVVYGPTLFLTRPARQIHREYLFMTDALYGVAL